MTLDVVIFYFASTRHELTLVPEILRIRVCTGEPATDPPPPAVPMLVMHVTDVLLWRTDTDDPATPVFPGAVRYVFSLAVSVALVALDTGLLLPPEIDLVDPRQGLRS
ncbi:hypothetical protein CVT25_010087 [Psilocybe cyanescens]|uniref:Uncharacterized protein n=1 Tax=Psilocybe cyanescens TaxID=93625 RepID=A0A409X388_PSICY|nr:hypothetical protein CVT25_010087 [Psilocybe cyanescens]